MRPTNRQVVRTLAHTAHALVRALELGEGVPFSSPKATVVADSPALDCHIRTALGHRGGKACTYATALGVDTTGGRGRCAARRNTRSHRLARCRTRRTRLRRITSAARAGRAIKFFVSRAFAPLPHTAPRSLASPQAPSTTYARLRLAPSARAPAAGR